MLMKVPLRATLPEIRAGRPGVPANSLPTVAAREAAADIAGDEVRRLERAPDILLEGDRAVDVLADGVVDRLLALERGLLRSTNHQMPADEQQAEAPDQPLQQARPCCGGRFRRRG